MFYRERAFFFWLLKAKFKKYAHDVRLIRTMESTVNPVEILNSSLVIGIISEFVNFNIFIFVSFYVLSVKNKCILPIYTHLC